MKRVTLTLAALGVLSVATGQAMAGGLKARSSRGIPILGQTSASTQVRNVARSHGSHHSKHQRSHHGSSHHHGYHHGQSYYGQPYMRPPIIVYPGMYGRYPYYAYPMPYRGFTYNGRGLSLNFGF